MEIFPSVWELIIPNFNITTVLGIACILIGILLYYVLFVPSKFFKTLGLPFDIHKIAPIMILLGVVLIWGVSIFVDFLKSTGGVIIFWGAVFLIVLGIILFWNPNAKKGDKLKLFE